MNKKILIISHDKVGPAMAGPGIRYHQIAIQLSVHFNVTLATFNPEYLENLRDVPYDFKDIKVYDFKPDFDQADVIFALWLSQEMIAYAKKRGIKLIFDLYAPVPVEDLIGRIYSHRTDNESDYDYSVSLQNYRLFFQNGDYFVCSNSNQKDFWNGFAFAAEAAMPSTYTNFPLYDRIGLAPMGIDINELKSATSKNPFIERHPSIQKDDFIIVWTGGIWDWFDAETPIRAIKNLVDDGYTNIKLVFLGTRHPNKDVPEMAETLNAYNLSKKLGLFDNNIIFLEGWIPYAERIDYLLNASIALYAHKPSIEARYSHRTRVLDHILTALPTISTKGDYLGADLKRNGFGLEVNPYDIDEMATAIKKYVNDKKFYVKTQKTIRAHQNQYSWEKSTESIVQFIKSDQEKRLLLKKPILIKTDSSKGLTRLKRSIPKPIKNHIKKYLRG